MEYIIVGLIIIGAAALALRAAYVRGRVDGVTEGLRHG